MSAFYASGLLDWVGFAGVVFYIGYYAALQGGLIRGSSYAYAALNLIAASLVLISLSASFNLSAAIVQVFWIVISIFGIARIFWLRHRIRFNAEETAFLNDALPHYPKTAARRLLDAGTWRDARDGVVLTTEGEPVTHLHYIASGSARVEAGGATVAEIARGMVGEMNVLEAGPASASVIVESGARVFTVSGDALRRICRTDGEFRLFLEQSLSTATRRKLIEANARLARKDELP